ncbi:hypothetical protein LU604_22845 [Erwinia tracheiphila]|nr:hypothetical protein [Erwinia tracheiphila]UIA85851.1 hypothetical protein LU604_22845 [Erwinia tracheiphila]UIA94374.1 hypothetical protein LU632_22310 [Erwinia tracheiphila]
MMRFFSHSDRHLWRLALPMILYNISVPLLGLVDTVVTDHLNNASYLGGVAVGSGNRSCQSVGYMLSAGRHVYSRQAGQRDA